MKKFKLPVFLLVLFTLRFSLFTFHCYAQDRPAKPPLLPFQQNAADQGAGDEQLAMQLYMSQDFEKAGDLFEALYEKKPGSYLYSYLFTCYVETRQFSKAEKLVREQKKFEGNSLKYMVDLGYIQYRQGNDDKSKKIYDDALKKLEANQQQIFDLAGAFINRGEYDYALKTYRKGKQLLNDTYPFGFEIASVLERTGDYAGLVDEYLSLLEYNKAYMTTIEDRLQNLLVNDPDNTRNEMFRKALLTKVQKDPEKTYYSEMLWWYSIQQKDFELALIQAKALDRRLKEDGSRVLQVARLAVSNENYAVAEEGYQYLVSKGPVCPYYQVGESELLNTRFLRLTSEGKADATSLEALEKEYVAAITETGDQPEAAEMIRNLSHLYAFYLHQPDKATDLLNRSLEMKSLPAEERARCKMELADILLLNNDPWEATLLYQQVYKDYKNDVLGQEAKFRNTKLSFYIGEFAWAKAQADILKAATSRLIANDAIAMSVLIGENYDPDSTTFGLQMYARADLDDFRNEDELALETLDSVPVKFPGHPILDDVLLKKAGILEKMGKYQDADSVLAQLVSTYPESVLADEALFGRARIREKYLDDKVGAMEYYEALLTKFPGSIFVPEARQRFRNLRGDKVQQ